MKRRFFIGDEWLYYKIYLGIKTSDELLIKLTPFIKEMLNEKVINEWFFIRYADPDYHLRLRFHINNDHLQDFIIKFNGLVDFYLQCGLVWKVQTDTYVRELERYGSQSIIHAENIFHHDSNLIVNVLGILPEGEENYRWLYALKSIDILLDDFNIDLTNKLRIITIVKNEFGKEFKVNKQVKIQIDRKFRLNRENIEMILQNKSRFSLNKDIIDELKKRSSNIRSTLKKLKEQNRESQNILDGMILSYIHMSLNRWFRSKQRLHELVIYNLLSRYYKSQLARN